MSKDTLVIGVSANSSRYANILVSKLQEHRIKVFPFGRSKGEVFGLKILNEWNPDWEVDTVSLYLRADHQKDYYKKIIGLHPRRVIFNPGTENQEFESLLRDAGIMSEEACSLVLLSTGQY
ncbi:MAG: CoA-binding protein [Flavobacteriaceae bacterium]